MTTRKSKKSVWIDKGLHNKYKSLAVYRSKSEDRTVSLEEIINEALEIFIKKEEDQKENEFTKQNRILPDSQTPG